MITTGSSSRDPLSVLYRIQRAASDDMFQQTNKFTINTFSRGELASISSQYVKQLSILYIYSQQIKSSIIAFAYGKRQSTGISGICCFISAVFVMYTSTSKQLLPLLIRFIKTLVWPMRHILFTTNT